MRPQVFDKGLREAKARANIENRDKRLEACFHDLRHTCATRMGESDMPITVLDMSVKIFETTYAHVSDEAKRRWINNISTRRE